MKNHRYVRQFILLLALFTAAGCNDAGGEDADVPEIAPSVRNPEICEAEASQPWVDACIRGVTYRAVGQEPGWVLEIGPQRIMLLETDYGEHRHEGVLNPPDREGRRLSYTASAGGASVTITIEEEPCQDIMSGEAFPTSVSVTVDDRQLDGCGRPVGMGGSQ
jgi:putative lipoprotein